MTNMLITMMTITMVMTIILFIAVPCMKLKSSLFIMRLFWMSNTNSNSYRSASTMMIAFVIVFMRGSCDCSNNSKNHALR